MDRHLASVADGDCDRELYLEFTKEANSQSHREFAEALEINREFADAMVYLAWAHNSDARYGWSRSPEDSWKTALDLLRQAIAVDEHLALAYSTLAYIHLFHGEFEEALADAERAVALNPNGADEYHILAMVHCYSGQPEEAIDEQRQALRLNPLSPTMSVVELGRAFCQMGRYEDAVGPLMQVVAQRPYWRSARLLLALAFNESGREKEATVQVKAFLRSNRNFSLVAEAKNHPYKNPADLQRYLDALRKAGLPE